jgi:hypothetical protein
MILVNFATLVCQLKRMCLHSDGKFYAFGTAYKLTETKQEDEKAKLGRYKVCIIFGRYTVRNMLHFCATTKEQAIMLVAANKNDKGLANKPTSTASIA